MVERRAVRRITPVLVILLVQSQSVGCATRQLARAVGAGRTEFGVLVGGPLQSALGFTAPIPEHRVHARVGLTDDIDLSGSIPLAPVASSILALDVGFVGQLVRIPELAMAASARMHCVYDLDDGGQDASYYPELLTDLEIDNCARIAELDEGMPVMLLHRDPAAP